jgi:predicted alpha/beta superfamily hydrolase
MKMLGCRVAWLMNAVALGIPAAGGGQAVLVSPATPYVVPQTFEYMLQSSITGWTYRVLVSLPRAYDSSPADSTRYPVLYMLDGGLYLPRGATDFRNTTTEGAGSVILVGVGRPGGPPLGQAEIAAGNVPYRVHDMSPTEDSPGVGGGAPDFLRVIKEEIIPFIDQEFRTTSDRGIFGHSMGGLFASWVLLAEPDVFSRYGISSPSLFWDNEVLFTQEARVPSGPILPKRVHLSVGGDEGVLMVSLMWRMTYALCHDLYEPFYEGLHISNEVIEDTPHSSPVHLWRVVEQLYPTSATRPLPDPC